MCLRFVALDCLVFRKLFLFVCLALFVFSTACGHSNWIIWHLAPRRLDQKRALAAGAELPFDPKSVKDCCCSNPPSCSTRFLCRVVLKGICHCWTCFFGSQLRAPKQCQSCPSASCFSPMCQLLPVCVGNIGGVDPEVDRRGGRIIGS